MRLRRRIHAYEEKDTCGGGELNTTLKRLRRRIHAYEEEDTCGGGELKTTLKRLMRFGARDL
jgi:hypothetical protein